MRKTGCCFGYFRMSFEVAITGCFEQLLRTDLLGVTSAGAGRSS
jgi:hypothetical protein